MEMANAKPDYSHRQCLLAAFTGWLVMALLVWPGIYTATILPVPDFSVEDTLVRALLTTLPWGVAGWLVLVFSRQFWGRQLSRKIWISVQLILGVMAVLIILALMDIFGWRVSGLANTLPAPNFGQMLLRGLPQGLLIYAGIWAVCQTWLLLHRCRELEYKLVNAELRRLRTQLNPHFLFNSLTAISELGYKDPSRADRTITQLSSLLRKSLDDSHQQEIALRDELEFLKRYLDIQQTLFEEGLQIEIRIPENLLNARVPGMILQPLVENAITHGIVSSGNSWLGVRATRDSDNLVIEVEDNGWGLVETGTHREHEGIGVANTRARLRYLYGELANLELRSRPGEGLTARLSLPYHEAYAYNETAYPDR